VDPETRESARREWADRLNQPVIVTSSVARIGLDELRAELVGAVPVEQPAPPSDDDLAEHRVFRPAADRAYTVERTGDGTYRVTGTGIERLVARYDLDNEDALAHLERRLRGIGVIHALEAEGFEPGDEVEIAGIAFDLDPEV
jgi:GTP-binding protein